MKKAIFLDRDGVVNYEQSEYTYEINKFKINDGIVDSLKKFQGKKFLLIIITNQGGIAKNLYKKEDVEKIHQYLIKYLKKQGIVLTEIYYCPHHPVKENCLCRKPDSLLIEKAIARFQIAPTHSFFIGDNERDILAAKKVGLNTIRIKTNENIRKYCDSICH
jgi:D-glycero-D-manno-heptose 1,7-bisphosphate phosphatase